MAGASTSNDEETQPLAHSAHEARPSSESHREEGSSVSSASTTSLILENINGHASNKSKLFSEPYSDSNGHAPGAKRESFDNIEDGGKYIGVRNVDKKYRRILVVIAVVALLGWAVALFSFVSSGKYIHSSATPHDPAATSTRGSGRKITLDEVMYGQWGARRHGLSWIEGRFGKDGYILEQGEEGKDYLVVEDVRHRNEKGLLKDTITLMRDDSFQIDGQFVKPSKVWPSPNFKRVLVMSDEQKNWRHSYTGLYWLFDVESQTAEPLDPNDPDARIQLASWAPDSGSVVFTRNNNMFLRHIYKGGVEQITTDGGKDLFYGVPDWVYEEEVFSGNSVTWWSEDSKFIAFLRTNESEVPTYPVQYFLSRPSGKKPPPGEENYPEVRQIKYPKAGAPNPVVNLQFYDVEQKEVFEVDLEDDFPDEDRLITEIVWAGKSKKVLVRETNRESDILKVTLVDVGRRNGKTVRTEDVNALDGGWFEVSETTTFIPGDPRKSRAHDGYIDTVIHEGYDHLAYFMPMDSTEPVLLTKGPWEVVKAPSAIDLEKNLVYFVATREGSTQRHVYSVNLDGTNLQPITDIEEEGYYDVSFSSGAGYALLSYEGPNVPWQKIISTPSSPETYEEVIEQNDKLKQMASQHEMPILNYETITVDGFDLNVLERRPPHFNEKQRKQYPVLFYMYQGPGSQSVSKKFNVDFQAHVASMLGYIVVTVDGRGTGFKGRKTRTIVRGNIGYYESHDQIEAARMWAARKYVDEKRMAIWGWSYGGFMTLKTLEQDCGRTFRYGMAVAPVTDWRFYDSIYTERYMHTPQNNPDGYDNATITDVGCLRDNVRFLFMHGVADDNVHFQSSLTLMDRLDLAGVENFDMQVFPDSDHSIYFHNANRIVYDKLSNWLVNAFNGEWLRIADPTPMVLDSARQKRAVDFAA